MLSMTPLSCFFADDDVMLAGHTWVLLATAVRKSSGGHKQYYRIQRPNNVTLSDMSEDALLLVCAHLTSAWSVGAAYLT